MTSSGAVWPGLELMSTADAVIVSLRFGGALAGSGMLAVTVMSVVLPPGKGGTNTTESFIAVGHAGESLLKWMTIRVTPSACLALTVIGMLRPTPTLSPSAGEMILSFGPETI